MEKLKANLQMDNKLFMKYLVMKRGFDPEDPEEYQQALDLYMKKDKSPILTSDMKGDKYWCQIASSLVPSELKNCLAAIKVA